jgi:hypothetical protein
MRWVAGGSMPVSSVSNSARWAVESPSIRARLTEICNADSKSMCIGLMTGLIMIRRSVPFGRAIEELLLILECSADDELMGRVTYLPI